MRAAVFSHTPKAHTGRAAGVGPCCRTKRKRVLFMGDDRIQDAKGRAKEAIGSVTGNDDLKNKGKTDQAKASIKGKVGDVVDGVKDKVDEITNR